MSIPYGSNRDISIEPPPGFNPARIIREGKPEWIMLGMDWPGPGVLLVASRNLDSAHLDYRARQYDFSDWSQFMNQFQQGLEFTLSVHLRDWVFTAGPNYATCLAALLRQWDPDSGPRAIGGSDDG